MHLIIYEVVEVLSIGDHRSLGLFFRPLSARKVAREAALKGGFKKIKGKLSWGEEDDYGMLRGVFISTRKVEE